MPTSFALIYETMNYAKKFEPKFRLIRQQALEKKAAASRKQCKEEKFKLEPPRKVFCRSIYPEKGNKIIVDKQNISHFSDNLFTTVLLFKAAHNCCFLMKNVNFMNLSFTLNCLHRLCRYYKIEFPRNYSHWQH